METPALVEIRLRQSPMVGRAPNSIPYQVALDTPNLSEEVMHLATRIVEMAPEPGSVHLSFRGTENSPELLSAEGFCSFAKLLNVALPAWPHLLFAGDNVQPCLFLAGMNRLLVTKLAAQSFWVVTVPSETFETEMASMKERLALALSPQLAANYIASLTRGLGQ